MECLGRLVLFLEFRSITTLDTIANLLSLTISRLKGSVIWLSGTDVLLGFVVVQIIG